MKRIVFIAGMIIFPVLGWWLPSQFQGIYHTIAVVALSAVSFCFGMKVAEMNDPTDI